MFKSVLRLVWLLITVSYFEIGLSAQAEHAEFARRGAATCLKCHDEPVITNILQTAHAIKADDRTPFAQHDCESCHGASPEHIKTAKAEQAKDRVPPAIVFGAHSSTPVSEQNQTCLHCHQQGLRMHWQGSQHEFADLSCASCHSLHTLHDAVRERHTQSAVCFNCHAEQRAQINRRSRHPIRDQKTICTDCHNPHGSTGDWLLIENTVNETCFLCHNEKRGPFLWEHPPVQEDCSLCHTAHGSSQPRLLKIRAPYLCQQCHSDSESTHANISYSGLDAPPFGVQSRLLLKSCLNCHINIHGSNHPSGARFDR
ncbi:MAG: DmsE family decaheme c-type cytochrome [Gammaproteobacteria bacterium]|nr:DmsE family decaheme c-type cytochrome [Gammaproteobacteria bacterium]